MRLCRIRNISFLLVLTAQAISGPSSPRGTVHRATKLCKFRLNMLKCDTDNSPDMTSFCVSARLHALSQRRNSSIYGHRGSVVL